MGIRVIQSSFSDGSFTDISRQKLVKPCLIESDQRKSQDADDECNDAISKLFTCPNEGCIKSFQRYASLENHLHYGKCELTQEKESLFDLAKIAYHEKLLQSQTAQPTLEAMETDKNECKPAAKRGWALKTSKKSSRFSEKQKAYLDEAFEIGQETGHKQDPTTVSTQMRYARDLNGKRRFDYTEFLSPTQIQSYFSRRARKLKKGSVMEQGDGLQEDEIADAAEEEETYHLTRSRVLDQCQLIHPVLYESINLCQLFAKNNMNKLSIPVLKCICDELDLDTLSISSRRKAPYIELISDVINSCSCQAFTTP